MKDIRWWSNFGKHVFDLKLLLITKLIQILFIRIINQEVASLLVIYTYICIHEYEYICIYMCVFSCEQKNSKKSSPINPNVGWWLNMTKELKIFQKNGHGNYILRNIDDAGLEDEVAKLNSMPLHLGASVLSNIKRIMNNFFHAIDEFFYEWCLLCR